MNNPADTMIEALTREESRLAKGDILAALKGIKVLKDTIKNVKDLSPLDLFISIVSTRVKFIKQMNILSEC